MDFALETTWVLTLTLATCRVAGVAILAPPMGSAVVPFRLRVGLAMVMGLAALGRLAHPVAVSSVPWDFAAACGVELLIGATIGYAARLLFVGVQLGATHIAQQIGVGLADAMNPGEADHSGAVRRLFAVLAVVVFVLIGGHNSVAAGLMRTFDTVPLGGLMHLDGVVRPAGLLGMVVSLLGASFLLALKVAAPVLLAMLVTTIALGLLQRSLPQCNILSVGLPVRAMLGMVILVGAIAMLTPLMEQAWVHTENVLQHALETTP